MISLFIDTCADSLIISVIKNMEMIYYFQEKNDTDLSKKVLPIIEEAFQTNQIDSKDINKIFVVTGPGSFTGIRVGITIAKMMGQCLNIPIISLSELELLATSSVGIRIPIIDARRGYVYGAVYNDNLEPIIKDQYIDYEEFKKTFPEQYTIIDKYDNIDVLSVIEKHMNDQPIRPHDLIPNYLKKTEAEENL